MIWKILKAAFTRPWEDEPEVGDGAPDDWEIRLSPDEATFTIWNPVHQGWVVFQKVIPLAKGTGLQDWERRTRDWTVFLPLVDDEDDE